MTRNQIDYWRNVETERHNRATEQQALVDSDIKKESNRIQAVSVAETQRSNQAQEAETQRANLAREQNDLLRNQETARSNLARETETQRSNKANEAIDLARLYEQTRANKAQEFIQANQNPWTSLVTTIDKFLNPSSPVADSSPNPIPKALSNIADKAVGMAVQYGFAKPNSTTVLNNGVKQLPNLKEYTQSSPSKQPSLYGNNPTTPKKRISTPASKSTPKPATTVGGNNPVKKVVNKVKPNIATRNLMNQKGVR